MIETVKTIPIRITLLSALIGFLIFVFDLALPLGVAAGVPYVALVLLGAWFPERRHVLILAAVATILIAVGYINSPPGGVFWVVLTNRALALFAVWVTAILLVHRKQAEHDLTAANAGLEDKVRERSEALLREYADKQRVKTHLMEAIESISEGIILFDRDDRIVICNRRHKEFYPKLADILVTGTKREDMLRAMIDRQMIPDIGDDPENWLEDAMNRRDEYEIPGERMLADGTWIRVRRYRTNDGGTLVLRTDITRQRQSDELVRKLSRVVEQSPSMVFITNLEGDIEYVNPKFTEVSGYALDEITGKNPRILKSGRTPTEAYPKLWQTILSGREWRGELADRRKDGSSFWAYATISPVADDKGEITHYVAVHEDITERKLAEAEIRHAKEQAEIANRTKSELLANMSHELRTPLNAIIGFSEAIESGIFGPLGSEKYEEYIADIKASGKHLLDIINDILDVSAIEAGKMAINEDEFNIADIVEASVRLVRPRAEQNNVRLTTKIENSRLRLRADERRVKQIILNLLSNAVKFTPDGGNVTLKTVLLGDGTFRLRISDSGIGMDQADIVTALVEFGQVDSSLSRQHEGTGLGLPLTKGLVELHGGTLEIESGRGMGTTVSVFFPKERILGHGLINGGEL